MTIGKFEYIYTKIPIDYVAIYHAIIQELADYGEQALKECKASCKDRNTDVINCYNMFNAAVVAKRLQKNKLAETLIKYIEAKLNQLGIKTKDTSFEFYIGDNNEIKAIINIDKDGKITITMSMSNSYFYVKIDGIKYFVYVPGTINPYTNKLFVFICRSVDGNENKYLIVTDDNTITVSEQSSGTKEQIHDTLEGLGFSPQYIGNSFYGGGKLILDTHNGDFHDNPEIECILSDNESKISNIENLLN